MPISKGNSNDFSFCYADKHRSFPTSAIDTLCRLPWQDLCREKDVFDEKSGYCALHFPRLTCIIDV